MRSLRQRQRKRLDDEQITHRSATDWDIECTSRLFELSGWILQALPDESDRKLLRTRLVKKLTSVRRGNLKLPAHFPPEVVSLTSLTKSQLRSRAFYVTGETLNYSKPNRRTVEYIKQVLPGECIRSVYGSVAVHEWQRKMVKPLSESDWPRLGTKPAWPSTPTLSESLEMARRGLSPRAIYKPNPAQHGISVAEFNSNVGLRANLINQQIVGVRSDIKVPKRFLGHFRYRWNFLILTSPQLPSGLVRFLTGLWIRNPHNLWLREKCRFKSYLKSCTPTRRTVGPW